MSWLRNFGRRSNFRIDHGDYTVLDTETTGFDVQNDRVVSVGLLRMRGGRIVIKESLELFIQQERGLKESAFIHGITQEQLKNGLTEKHAVMQIRDFVGDDILVAHFAPFDRDMLDQCFKRQKQSKLPNQWLDTMDLEVGIDPDCEGNAQKLTLDALLQKRDIKAVQRHTALGDAYSTALLLQQQLSECAAKGIFESNQLHGRRSSLL